jgi:hypothetical protein
MSDHELLERVRGRVADEYGLSVNLEFPKWFEPFAANYPRPHPFAIGRE